MNHYMRAQQLAEFLAIGRSTVWRWVANGNLPKPIKLTGGVSVWRTEDIISLTKAKEIS